MRKSAFQMVAERRAKQLQEFIGVPVSVDRVIMDGDAWINISIIYADEEVWQQVDTWTEAMDFLKGYMKAAQHYDKPF